MRHPTVEVISMTFYVTDSEAPELIVFKIRGVYIYVRTVFYYRRFIVPWYHILFLGCVTHLFAVVCRSSWRGQGEHPSTLLNSQPQKASFTYWSFRTLLDVALYALRNSLWTIPAREPPVVSTMRIQAIKEHPVVIHDILFCCFSLPTSVRMVGDSSFPSLSVALLGGKDVKPIDLLGFGPWVWSPWVRVYLPFAVPMPFSMDPWNGMPLVYRQRFLPALAF